MMIGDRDSRHNH